MSTKELSELIKSFHKKPGEYTRDELYEIGLAHKELNQKDKSWASLCEVVGWEGAPNSYRNFVNKRANRDKEDETISTSESNEYEQARRELYREKIKVRDIYNEYRKDMREDSRIESLKESIIEAAGQLNALPKVRVADSRNLKDTEAVLIFSDLHIGPEFNNSYNEYNYDIACKRVSKLVKDTIFYCKQNRVKRLHFLNLGDLISGLIHTTIRLGQRLDLTEQIMKAAELTAQVVNELQAAAPEVVYRSVVDNHSRAVADKNDHIEKENFNKIIDWFIEERLKGTNIIFAHDNIDDGIGKFKLENGKTIMFAHGHEDKKTTVVQDFIGVTREFVDYVILGHFHSGAEKTFQGAKVIINGSIIGVDPYAYGRRLFSEPEQKLLVFDKDDNLLNISINLNIK